jgi:hypothetical protein
MSANLRIAQEVTITGSLAGSFGMSEITLGDSSGLQGQLVKVL